MKYLLMLTTLLILLTNCGPEAKTYDRQYIIKNESSKKIILTFFNQGSIVNYLTDSLAPEENHEGQVLERSGGPWEDFSREELISEPTASLEADSIRVVFNSEKLMTYVMKYVKGGSEFIPTTRNVLRDLDYKSIGDHKFLFEITDADYNNAADCDGNCE